MHYLGTNIQPGFGFLKKLKHIILSNHFYLFQNGLIDFLTTKDSRCFQKMCCFAQKFEFRVSKLFQRMCFFSVVTFYSYLWLIITLSLYLHFKHVSLFQILEFYHLTIGDTSNSISSSHKENQHCIKYARIQVFTGLYSPV